MKLKSILIKDFRLFYGEHKITFAQKTDAPITLFIGENGSGKTTLMNAIHWVLTDKCTERLSAPDELVNKDALREKRRECSVTLEIIDDSGRLIAISRSKVEDHSHSSLRAYEIIGGAHTELHSDDATFLSRFFPPTLAQWFIFDGEALGGMNLSGDIQFKSELQQAFGFDALETLKGDFNALIKQYEGEESKKKNNDRLSELLNFIQQADQFIEISNKEVGFRAAEHENKKRMAAGYRKELSQLAPSADWQKRRDTAKQKGDEFKNQIKGKSEARASLVGSSATPLVLMSALQKLDNVFITKNQKSSIPAPFGDRLIDDIVSSAQCICGREVQKGSKEYENIQKLLTIASTSLLNHRISEVRSKITAIRGSAEDFWGRWNELNSDIMGLENNRLEQQQAYDAADEQIKKIDHEGIRQLNEQAIQAEGESEKALEEKGRIAGLISQREEDKRKWEEEKSNLLSKLTRDEAIVAKLRKLTTLKSHLDLAISMQEKEVLQVLSDELSEVIKRYLTKNFSVKVDSSNYRVDVFDSDGTVAHLSTGEWVLVKLAFVATMVGMAANKTQISTVNWVSDPVVAPLVLDAPFSVLDSEYRISTAKNLAEQVQQLILMTSKDDWVPLMPELESKIGKAYLIKSFAKGPPKDIEKVLHLNGNMHKMNYYDCERDESKIVEI